MFRHYCARVLVVVNVIAAVSVGLSLFAGTWAPLSHLAPTGINTMLLLPDGTVMCADGSKEWYLLKPDANGGYVNGTWSSLASMNDSRLYYASAVLTNGQVFLAGGEFGTGTSSAEVYDPLLNSWTMASGVGALFSDACSVVLPNGNVLVAPVWPTNYAGTMIYVTVTGTWRAGPNLVRGFDQDEASWVKLPDDSIITDDPYGLSATNSERYIPSLNQWRNDSTVPVSVYDAGDELGAATLLPNGKAFFIGAGGHTALYTPSGNLNPGVWSAGPDIPGGFGAPDAPAAMMVDGHVLCAVIGSSPPTAFFEYDPVANAFSSVPGPSSITNSLQPYYTRMLDLPDGTVLYSLSSSQLYNYTPGGAALALGQPTIVSIKTNSYRSYHLMGKLLGGISQGATYGDDAQMDSNYPLVRMTNNSSGNVYYARTFAWTSTSVFATNATNSTEFVVPADLPSGNYSLVLVANGNSSTPVPFTFAQDTLKLSSLTGFVAVGPTNGPFTPSSSIYTLTNTGASSLDWFAYGTSTWINVSPSAGTLLPGGPSTNITVALTTAATNLATGKYSTTIFVSNQTSTAAQTIPFSLRANPLVINGGFEFGSFAFWNTSGDIGNTIVGNVGDYSSVNSIIERTFINSGVHGAILGQNASLGHISQPISTAPGRLYSLSFWLRNPTSTPSNEFLVSWNGATLYDKLNLPTFAATNMQFVVAASATSTLLDFGFRTSTNYFGLDDITLTAIAPPRLTNVVHNPDGSFTMHLITTAGVSTRILATSNLNAPISWLPIYTNLAGGSWQFTDVSTTNLPGRYYRASTP